MNPTALTDRWRPGLVVVAALIVRLVALAFTYPDRFFFGKYLVLGQELVRSGMIAERPFSYSPIYCYFIAFGKLIVGESVWPILLLQVILGSLACLLLYAIARRFVGRSWATAVALGAAFYRSFVLYDVTLLSDALGLLLQLLLLWILVGFERRLDRRGLLLAGALIGLCILQRPHCVLLLPGLLVGLRVGGLRWRPALRALALSAAAAILITLPIVLQNFRLTGSPGTTASNPGYIFYSSNNSSTYGFRYSPPELYFSGARYYERQPPPDGRFVGDAEIAAMISGAVTGEPMSLAASSRFYFGFTFAHMGRYPTHYLGLLLQRAQLAFHAFEAHDVLPVFARYDKIARLTPIRFGWLAPLGLLGVALSFAEWRRYVWLYVLLLNQLALLLGFYVVVRFRLPVEALMLLFAAVAGRRLFDWLRVRDSRRLLAATLALAALVTLTHWLPRKTADRAHGRDMEILLEDATRLLQRGQTDEAAQRLSRLIARDREILPRGFQARTLLARSAVPLDYDRWDPGEARQRLQVRRQDGELTLKELRYLAWLELGAGAVEAARAVLVEYLAQRPQDSLVRFELARLQYGQGRSDDAWRNLQAAIEDGLLLTTRGIHGCELLARIARDSGDTQDARRWIAQAAQLSILLPWYVDGVSGREMSQRLMGSDGYVPPGDLNELLPY